MPKAKPTNELRRKREAKRSFWKKIARLVKFRVAVPTLRSPYPPHHSARGALVGLAWAMTPLIGIQMWLCFITWIIARKTFKWDFSLVIACAWTWVTNVFTMIPAYYVFYLTGYYMLRVAGFIGGEAHSYHQFTNLFQVLFAEAGMFEALKISGHALFLKWGLAMSVGCIPWAIVSGWLGYKYTLRYTLARQARISARRHENTA